jgi:hypothetical protein
MSISKIHKCFLATSLIGSLLICLNLRSEEPSEGLQDGLVAVDPMYISSEEQNKNYELIHYKERREKSGSTFAILMSKYEPLNFQPTFSILSFEEVYGVDQGSGIEIQFSQKNNYSFISFSYEFTVGHYLVDSLSTASDVSTLTINPIGVGAKLSLDTFFKEPYFVPYVGGGAYLAMYSEVQNSNPTKSGNTQIAGYYNIGFLMQLDWVDKDTSRKAYEESGLENTFIIIEGKQYIASSNGVDPDFSTVLQLNAGLLMEF